MDFIISPFGTIIWPHLLSYLGLSLLEGAGDTTAVYLQSFFLCLLEHPEVMAKVQMDIDDVIGADRTPELEDLEELPYVQAIINEV